MSSYDDMTDKIPIEEEVVGVQTVDVKPRHSDGVKTQSIGRKISSRDTGCYVVRTGVGAVEQRYQWGDHYLENCS